MKIKYRVLTGIIVGFFLCGNVYAQPVTEPQIESQAAVVIDMDNGNILYKKKDSISTIFTTYLLIISQIILVNSVGFSTLRPSIKRA